MRPCFRESGCADDCERDVIAIAAGVADAPAMAAGGEDSAIGFAGKCALDRLFAGDIQDRESGTAGETFRRVDIEVSAQCDTAADGQRIRAGADVPAALAGDADMA